MYNILFVLILTVFGSVVAFGGQPAHFYSSSAHRPAETRRPANVQRVNQGPANDPALPDSQSNSKPSSLADRPSDVLPRRRKVNVRYRR